RSFPGERAVITDWRSGPAARWFALARLCSGRGPDEPDHQRAHLPAPGVHPHHLHPGRPFVDQPVPDEQGDADLLAGHRAHPWTHPPAPAAHVRNRPFSACSLGSRAHPDPRAQLLRLTFDGKIEVRSALTETGRSV